MSKKLPAHAGGTAKAGHAATVPEAPVKDHSRDAEQLEADQQARDKMKREAEANAVKITAELWEKRRNPGEPFDVWMKRFVKEVAEHASKIAKR